MERELNNEFKYIAPPTKEELLETILDKDLKDIENYKTKILEGNCPFMLNEGRFFARFFNVSGTLIPENLFDYLNKLPEEERKNFTYNDLKEKGLDLIMPTEYDLIKFLSRPEEIITRNLTEYFKNQKHLDSLPRDKEHFDVLDKMMFLYVNKEINCPELLEMIMDIKQLKEINLDDREKRHLLDTFLLSLNPNEKEFLLPSTVRESENVEKYLKHSLGNFFGQETLRCITGFANLTKETLDTLAPYLKDKKCLEICSGSGLLAHQLQIRGIDVIPTDMANKETNYYDVLKTEPFTNIRQMDGLEAIKQIDADVLIMSWPPYNDPIAANALEAFFEKNPDGQIIYIGEWEWGCTADSKFFHIINERNMNVQYLNVKYAPLYSIHDTFYSISLN